MVSLLRNDFQAELIRKELSDKKTNGSKTIDQNLFVK